MEYIAHIRQSDKKIQTVAEHLLEVRELAEGFGEKLNVKHIAGLAGLLHDMGKFTEEFRTYILEAVFHPEKPSRRGEVDHSTAGGKLLFELFHDPTQAKPGMDKNIIKNRMILAEVVGNAIISHHSYLHDFLNQELESKYLKRVCKNTLEEFEHTKALFFQEVISETAFYDYVDQAVSELNTYLQKENAGSLEMRVMFLTKFIFSALIDGDRSNTRCFEEQQVDEDIDRQAVFSLFYERLMAHIEDLAANEDRDSRINRLRREMSEQCDQFAARPSGINTLSIPTGGGKTLASLRYALKHALQNGEGCTPKKHIIYVVPYTTIIEQNAEEVRRILQDESYILEHHSNVVDDEDENEQQNELEDGFINTRQKLKLARDNWDSPIIFTTMVQFLNAFYAGGTRNIRRLHNLSQSVIIFDEVQKVPVPCVSLFNQAVNFLNTYADSSIVLCTATQPELDFVENKLNIQPDGEMIGYLEDVVQAFRRVEIVDRATGELFDTDSLADFVIEKAEEVQSVLVILNTKAVVKKLYQKLLEQNLSIPIYHLSTSMCAAHRNDILRDVRERLAHGQPVICISTQLIEAGVDVSFNCVVRSLAGLDSIAQAAGRCNRHGKDHLRQVYVIDHGEENLDKLKEIRIGKEITAKILKDLQRDPSAYGGSVLSIQAMEQFFQEFYTAFDSSLDYPIAELGKKMTELLWSARKVSPYFQAYCDEHKIAPPLMLVNSYRTAADYFEVIASHTTSVIVPYGEGEEIIADLNGQHSIEDLSRLLRKAQQYSVNLFNHEKDALSKNQGLVAYLDGKVLALTEGAYHVDYGINIENDSPMGLQMW